MSCAAVAVLSGLACGDDGGGLPAKDPDSPAPWDPGSPYEPAVSSEELSTKVSNPLLPAPPGARWVYEGQTEEGFERIEVSVLKDTKRVWGTVATIVRDTVFLDDNIIEDTWDWYAQDGAGNVWYLGEDTYEYDDGKVVCECGAWAAGVDGALPGVVMLAEPKVGDAYRQEFYEGTAEDLAEVIETGVRVDLAAGSFEDCVKTRELSALEPDVEEFKVACPGVGVVLEEVPADEERIELVEYTVEY